MEYLITKAEFFNRKQFYRRLKRGIMYMFLTTAINHEIKQRAFTRNNIKTFSKR